MSILRKNPSLTPMEMSRIVSVRLGSAVRTLGWTGLGLGSPGGPLMILTCSSCGTVNQHSGLTDAIVSQLLRPLTVRISQRR